MTFSDDELLFRDSERLKYEKVWNIPSYRTQSDGLPAVYEAFVKMGCKVGDTLIDWGCGMGRSAALFQELGLDVVGFDIASNCLDPDIDIPLVVGSIWEARTGLDADYAFCTDVLEHIPPDYIDASLNMILDRTHRAAFIQVDTVEDISGPAMDPPQILHLCVQDRKWWRDQLQKRWSKVKGSPGDFTRWRFLCVK